MSRMQRRQFLGAAAGLAACLAHGQRAPTTSGKRTIAILVFDAQVIGGLRDAIKLRLRELGWVEGENIAFEYVLAGGSKDYRGIAERVVRRRVDLIVALGPSEAVAAAAATREIPIVFLNVAFPVEQGLVASHARPGRNVTGVAAASGVELLVKRLEILKEIAPAATRLAWIRESSRIPGTLAGVPIDLGPQESAVHRLGYRFRVFEPRAGDFGATAREMLAWQTQAVTLNEVVWGTFTHAIEFALRHRLPSAASHSLFPLDGGLLSLHIDADELLRLSAEYIDHILRGRRPADLPVATPGRYQLYVNTRTAKAIGITLPPAVLLRADRVIE